MVIAALAAVLQPLLGTRKTPATNRTSTAAAVYRQLRTELEADRSSGTLSEKEYGSARRELDRAALDALDTGDDRGRAATATNRAGPIVVALALPAFSFGLYLQLGTPETIGHRDAETGLAPVTDDAAGTMPRSIEEMVARLKSRLVANPDDPDGWAMLGRSYAAMNRVENARDAFAQAVQRKRDDPAILVDYAEVLARLNGGDLRGQPAELVHAALQYAPGDRKALWLAGVAAFQAAEFQRALERLEQLRALGGFGPGQAEVIDNLLAQARDRVAGAGAEVAAARAPGPAAAAKLSSRVYLAPELAGETTPTQTVFILARAPEGPRMPLAVVRRQVGELPLTVTLDDSLAMAPDMRLSGFPEVIVEARVPKGGAPAPSPGDLQGVSGRIATGAGATVEIAINQVIR